MKQTGRTERARTSLSARATGALLLALLPLIAIWVAWLGHRVAPELPAQPSSAGKATRTPSPQSLSTPKPPAPPSPAPAAGKTMPASLVPPVPADAPYVADGQPQFFDTENVYEKIDGAAPPFLELGMKALMTQAYKGKDPKRYGCEVFVYDMGSAKGAKAIYDKERSGRPENAPVGDGGYRGGTTWIFHSGPYYVTVLNTDTDAPAGEFSEHLARALATNMAVPK